MYRFNMRWVAGIAVAASASLLASTMVNALSLAPDEPWSPEAITGNLSLSYTGNALILDGTSGEPTGAKNSYPYNASKATLARDPEATGFVDAHMIWGISQKTRPADADINDYGEVILSLPGSEKYVVQADDAFQQSANGDYLSYFIADVSFLPLSSGEYSVSLPSLSEQGSAATSAGWGLSVFDYNPNLPLTTFKPKWAQNEMSTTNKPESMRIGFTVNSKIEVPQSPFIFPRSQMREPASGFTQESDLTLGDRLSSGTQLRPFTAEEINEVALAYYISESSVNQESLTGIIDFLDSSTRETLDSMYRGAKVTVRVRIDNLTEESFYNSRLELELPAYIKYKPGSLVVPPGTINSGNYSDAKDEDPASFDATSNVIIWKPGNNAVSNTETPYLLKPEDATQELSFQAYMGEYPEGKRPNLTAALSGVTADGELIKTSIPTSDEAYYSGTLKVDIRTDLAMESALTPISATYWKLVVSIENKSPVSTPYSWSVSLPNGVQHVTDERNVNLCEEDKINIYSEKVNCNSTGAILPGATQVDELMLRVSERPDYLTWENVLVTPTGSMKDTNGLDNESAIVIQSDTFTRSPIANNDFLKLPGAAMGTVLDINISQNDFTQNSPVSVEIVNKAKYGTVSIDKFGQVSYILDGEVSVSQDIFSYYLLDNISGLRSNTATVTLDFSDN